MDNSQVYVWHDVCCQDVLLTLFHQPTMEANWGDQFLVTVHNNIVNPVEGIGFHWHGILQKKTPYYDGVVSVSQCPVPPGQCGI